MTAPLYWRNKALLAKIETSYGTDPVPTGAANAVLASNVSLRPMEGQDLNRDLMVPFMGNTGDIPVDVHVALDFEVELAGSGTAGTAPAFGPLLRACGLAETVTVGTDVTYTPVSTGFESVSIYFNIDGGLHKLLGARGSVKATVAKSAIPKLAFTFRGLFAPVTATALPAVTLTAWKDPLPASTTNTPTVTLHGQACVLESLEVDLVNQVEGRFLVGSESIVIVDRKPAGTASIEALPIGTVNWFAKAQPPKATGALALVHGVGAGKICQIDAPRVEIGRPSQTQVQGILHDQLPLKPRPTDAGNDEIVFTFK